MGKWREMLASSQHFLVFAAACLVVLRPGDARRLIGLAAMQLVVAIARFPWLTNHTLVYSIANLTLLACLCPTWLEQRRLSIGPRSITSTAHHGGVPSPWGATWYDRFAPVLRAELLVVYLVATFHKFNTDWFHPDESCAIIFWARMVHLLPGTESLLSLGLLMPYGALLIEFLLPILLVRPRWSLIGIFIGLIFHLTLGLVGFYRFSSLVTALYVLFLPDWFIHAAIADVSVWQRRASGLFAGVIHACLFRRLRQFLSGVVLVSCVWAVIQLPRMVSRSPLVLLKEQTRDSHRDWSLLFQSLWLIATVLLLLSLCVLIWRHGWRPSFIQPQNATAVPLRWLWLFPLLTLLNGLAPYMGLKTESSFSMFSNLRTSGRDSNHLLIRRPWALIAEGSDLVEIIATDDTELGRLQDRNYQLPWMELSTYVQNRIQHGDDFSLVLRRGGFEQDFPSVRAAREHFSETPWLTRKLTWFRAVSMDPVCPCTH